ncbi:MAG: tetratricopeptide repeat protein [Syntrophales bacterium]|nr:tetratricopeptide repeat protein [Syntrophales bacterium]
MKRIIAGLCVVLTFFFLNFSYAESPQAETNRAFALIDEGLKRYNVSDFRGAIERWETALATFQKFGNKQAIGTVIGTLGMAYGNLGDYRKAISYYEKALAIAEETGDKKGKGAVIGMLGFAYSNLGDYGKAISFHEKALVIAEKTGDKQAIGKVIGTLGNAYTYLGDNRKAISFYEKALAIAEEIGDKRGKGDALGNLGRSYKDLGDNRKAISYHEKALVIAEELGDKKGKGDQLDNLGNAYLNLGDSRKAISYFEKALTIAEETGDKKSMVSISVKVGAPYINLGDYRKAISYFEKALAIAEELGDKESKGQSLGSLGIAYGNLGDYRKAISFYEKALAIAEEIGDKESKGLSFGNMGTAYAKLGDYRKAISFYEKDLAIAEELGNKRGQQSAHANLGTVYNGLGDYRKAISFHEKALAMAEEMGDKHLIGTVVGNVGNAYRNLGDYRKAISFYEKAIDIEKEIGIPYGIPEGNLADAFLALDRDDEALAIYTKHNHSIRLGRYHLKKKEYTKAKDQFNRNREEDEKAKNASFILPEWIGLGLSHEGLIEYEEAYRWYKKAIDFMEDQRAALTVSEREHYLEGNEAGFPRIEAYEGTARCAFKLGKFEEAFYWAENTRGRIFSELLSKRHSGKGYKIPRELADEEEDLTDKIRQNKKQQQTAFEKNNTELLKQLENEYPALKAKMERLVDRLRKDHPQYASVKYPQPAKLSQVALKKGETIIEYEVTAPYTIGLVIRDGKIIKAFKVDRTRAELEAMVKKFRAPFQERQEGSGMNVFSLNLARGLSEILIGPALSVVKKDERLIIIPDESLNLLPFEALLLSAPIEALKEEAVLLSQQAAKQTDNGTVVDKNAIIRGLTKVPVTRSPGVNVAPRVTTHILFDTDSAQIKKESQKQMQEIVAAFRSEALKNTAIRIEGHTDSVGNPRYNLRLSRKRAEAVNDYLAKSGIHTNRLSFTGRGDTEPIADNKDKAGRRQNRRVDFVRVETEGAKQKASAAQLKNFIYATDEYPISYYQSASVLTLQRALNISRAKAQSFFGLGDPVYDAKDTRASGIRAVTIVAKQKELSSNDIAENEETKEAGYQFSRLVNTGKEVKEVSRLFGQSELLIGSDASEAKLKAEDLKTRRYVLFSTHGILGNEIPYIKQPALVLNLVGNDQEDGFLTASEIFEMDLNADIVGLSACKTGLGVQSAGEGVVGLSRAFMYAGTDTVLVSLWSVADESTYKLMVKFFDGLKNGKDKMTALKEAKNYLRNNGYDNPFYWAPFILMGETN